MNVNFVTELYRWVVDLVRGSSLDDEYADERGAEQSCICIDPRIVDGEESFLYFVTERDFSVPNWTEHEAAYTLQQPVEREYICTVCGTQHTHRTGREPDGNPRDHIKLKAEMSDEERAHFVYQFLGGAYSDPDAVTDKELKDEFEVPDEIKPLSQTAREESPEFDAANGIYSTDRPADWDHPSLRERAEAERLRQKADANEGSTSA